MGIPESVVLVELRSLDIHVLGVMQLRSGRSDKDPAKDHPPTPQFIVSVTRDPELSKVQTLTELCGLRLSVETLVTAKSPVECKCFQSFGYTQRNCGHAPRCVACEGAHLSGDCPASPAQPLYCICGGTTQRTTGAV